jgi:hypothetical protein
MYSKAAVIRRHDVLPLCVFLLVAPPVLFLRGVFVIAQSFDLLRDIIMAGCDVELIALLPFALMTLATKPGASRTR